MEFTEREKEVLDLLAQGLNNKEISETLCISTHTAKVHIASIYKKLDAKNRVQALIKYFQLDKTNINIIDDKE